MPEFPDITVYIEALTARIIQHPLERIQIASPFLLRTATPPVSSIEGRKVLQLRRLGKRICMGFEDKFWLVLHLMIAGRLHWKDASAISTRTPGKARGAVDHPPPKAQSVATKSKNHLATFHFDNGVLSLTEAGTQRRASLHVVQGEDALRALDRGGLELFPQSRRPRNRGQFAFVDLETFTRVLKSENHTLKRALTDPRLFSGIGNAYSDEILWNAQLSPVKLTQKLTDEEVLRLYDATRDTLLDWVKRLRTETNGAFPEKVTAFHSGMATHGRYLEPCPRCGTKIQRIRYATNETNYCPPCQTGGRLLADRALSRLLREDWPRTAEEFAW
jgi:formamidopyrimidine-DNA glycosylase